MFNKFEVGEWVIIVERDILCGFGGYVEQVDWTGMYLVRITTNKNGEPENGHLWLYETELMADEIALDEHDIQNLLDCSLATKDEKWFKELANQLQEV